MRLVPEAACFGGQLRHLLSDPEMAALLRAAPQAGRLLRPLCRILAVPPDPKLLPPPPKRVAPTPVSTWPAGPELPRTDPPPGGGPLGPPGPPGPQVAWRRWRRIRMPELVRRIEKA
jgi:hypothetical protein